MTDGGVTYVFIADVPASGLAAFRRCEDAVLPLLADHAGRLERRLRSACPADRGGSVLVWRVRRRRL